MLSDYIFVISAYVLSLIIGMLLLRAFIKNKNIIEIIVCFVVENKLQAPSMIGVTFLLGVMLTGTYLIIANVVVFSLFLFLRGF